MPSWLPDLRAVEAEQRRREGRCLRAYLEELACPDWPAWPAEHDGSYHAWVRAHWSIEACDRFDVIRSTSGELWRAVLRLLGHRIVYLGLDEQQARQELASCGWPVWTDEPADWEGWIAEHWDRDWADIFLGHLEGARRSLCWREDARQQLLEMAEREVEQHCRRARGELDADEMASVLERRVVGIRGRYCVLGSVWELRRGITEADIDAP